MNVGGAGGQGDDYQKYMKQYAGDYSKYYEKYMNGGGADAGKAADSGNESQALSGFQLSAQGGGADYQQYIDKYAGKYMNGGGGSDGKDMGEEYKKKYAGNWAAKNNMSQKEAMEKYAGVHFPKDFNKSDQKQWNKVFMDKYAKQYEHFDEERNAAPASAEDCHTVDELGAWRDSQLAIIRQYVPAGIPRNSAESGIHKSYAKNKARIAADKDAAAGESEKDDAAGESADGSSVDDASDDGDASTAAPLEVARAVESNAGFLKRDDASSLSSKAIVASAPAAAHAGGMGAPLAVLMITFAAAAVVVVSRRPAVTSAASPQGYINLDA